MLSNKQNSISADISISLKNANEALAEIERFVAEINDDYIDVEAWQIFHVWLDARPQYSSCYFSLFRAWQFFNWKPVPGTIPLPLDQNCRTIAESFLKIKGHLVPTEQLKIIKSGMDQNIDLFEIQSFSGDTMLVSGLLSKTKLSIYAPGFIKKGRAKDFIVAHAIPFDLYNYIFLGTSQFISRDAKPLVDEFAQFLRNYPFVKNSFDSLQSDFFNLFYDLQQYSIKS